VQECPWPFYRRLHAEDPVHYDPHTGLWMITEHAHLMEVASQWQVFSSEIDMRSDVSTVDPRPALEYLQREGWLAPDTLSQVDPPRHTQYRRLVERLFTGPVVRRMHAYLESHVAEIIDGFAHEGRVDFMERFAVPLPLDVICDQMGVPRADVPLMKRWTDHIAESLNATITAERRMECVRQIVEFQRYFAAKREQKRLEPAGDILSSLAVATKDDGAELTTEEYLATVAQLMVAGNETTRHHLAKGMLILAEQPELQRRLRAEPARIPVFVEESLRIEAPAQGLFRVCRRDYVLGGRTIPAGAKVLLSYGAANRDPGAFADPDRIDLDRPNANRHVSFGYGVHSCIGRVLATAELGIAFRQLLARLDDIRLAPDAPAPRHKPHLSLRGLDSLVVVFRPIGASAG
jgi:cytochrome P450